MATIVAEGKTAFLILASGSQVIMIDVEDHLSEPAVLCDLTQLTDDPSNLVEGIGVHFEKKKVFFSSSNGSVWALDKSQRSPKEPTRVVYSNPRASPSALTVDWLFNHLYIAERQQIQRCDLEGFNCRVVIQGLDGQPQDIQVDPCNGYLFWTVYGPEQGLFRADLADLQGKYPIAPGRPIYPSNVMQSFTVDYIPYRLYFPNSSNASMMSLYLDGRDAKVIHNNTQTSTWEHVTSLAFHQGLFYWSKLRSAASKSKKVYFEEYNPQSKLYFHSQMIFSSGKFARLRIWHPLNQPWPGDNCHNNSTLKQNNSTRAFPYRTGSGSERIPRIAIFEPQTVYNDRKLILFSRTPNAERITIITVTVCLNGLTKCGSADEFQLSVIPHMPPRELQALMSKISAALQWKPPALSQGEGAWSEWVYEVEAINLKNGQNQSFGLTKRLNLLDDHLLPDTSYKFRVRATSKGGHGPWSEFFEAATLKNHSTTPILVYSDNSVLGSAVYEGLLNGSNQNVKIEPTPAMGQIQDLEKCGDTLIWSSNFSREERRVFVKAGGRPTTRLHHVHNATAIAFDWLGNYIYWYNRKHNMIQRVSLDPTRGGTTPETVFDGSAVVQDIVLDSLQGYIYWTTGQTLESSLLNGEGRQSVERLPLYAARFIFGLACDLQGRALYWLRKDTDKLIVFRATLRSHPDDNMSHTVEQVVQFDFNGNYGYEKSPPLQFYSGKLFLLNGPHQLYVMDTGRKSLARLNLTTEAESRVTAFCIDHPSKYNYPENFSQSSPPTVVPPPVNMSSLTVTGPWNGFLLSWAPSTVDYGEVTYKIRISSASNAERKMQMLALNADTIYGMNYIRKKKKNYQGRNYHLFKCLCMM
ncbi:hypothetical protein CAPTEDRAFT_210985 [Capitella teleta]|uniref:Fibronectin type-III domain-containing protein n=1 Tax=Capitella teleta TaxID=283909 RepID=R7VE33_CAPTE|nr:hypothetical protein CAPTEDRAFT_210985 [Capitella teleta]|eukprot:ELU14561.1 hypothetical protein CAPTEDRAFT_210985 [Capitella teleta]